ncbi:MAG: hypothetical protein FJX20_07715 [Alphaproteobacteria bacterium]|nr:hypothetical protein [Alphaproteobacteria bacterium]
MALAFLATALLALSSAALAQSRPSAAQMERLIREALGDPQTVTFARPEPLGFTHKIVTHQTSYKRGGIEYSLAVVTPRQSDGLVFFSHDPARQLFIMHRTDTHLLRVSSARNDLTQGNAGLTTWSGPSADNDFSDQLAFWATIR